MRIHPVICVLILACGFVWGVNWAPEVQIWLQSAYRSTQPSLGLTCSESVDPVLYGASCEPTHGLESAQNALNKQKQSLLPALYEFTEPDYGFKVGVPEGWQKIVAADNESTSGNLEPGFAVGFESPRDDEHDKFADYILIEVLPGTDSGLFEADTSDSQIIIIDGEPARYDRILIDSASSDITPVDLMIHQAELRGLGYTIGLYAIGEPENDAIMSSAFEAMIRTFIRTATPFNVI